MDLLTVPPVTIDKLTAHLRKAARKRWEGKTKAEKIATATHAAKTYWDSLTPEERSAEMKRRAAKRAKKAK